MKKKWLALVPIVTTLSTIWSANSASIASAERRNNVTITWWSHDNPWFVAANKQLIKEFEKIHPNITINYQIFPYDALIQKLQASFAAHNPPDVAQVFGSWMPQYEKNGLLDAVPDGTHYKSMFFPTALGGYTYNGTLYGLPHEYNLDNGGILVHPDMLKQHGIAAPPKTWNDLIKDAQKLTIRNGNRIKVRGFDFINSDDVTFLFLSLILQQGGTYWTKDNHVNFLTPQAIHAMTIEKNFVTQLKVTDLSAVSGQLDTSDLFFKGETAIAFRGPWTIPYGLSTYKVHNFDYVPMPSLTTSPPYFAAETGWGEVVSAQSSHKQEDWEFVKFMMNKQQSEEWNVKTFTVPGNKSVASDPNFLKQVPDEKTSLDVLKFGRYIGPLQDRDFFFKTLYEEYQLIASNKVSVNQGLQSAQNTINQMIDQHLQQ